MLCCGKLPRASGPICGAYSYSPQLIHELLSALNLNRERVWLFKAHVVHPKLTKHKRLCYVFLYAVITEYFGANNMYPYRVAKPRHTMHLKSCCCFAHGLVIVRVGQPWGIAVFHLGFKLGTETPVL